MKNRFRAIRNQTETPSARQEGSLLLTGDALMRALAQAEGREVHGTLWLVGELVRARRMI